MNGAKKRIENPIYVFTLRINIWKKKLRNIEVAVI